MSRLTGRTALGVVVAVAVVATVAGGIRLMGSPREARARALDDRRESDLRAITIEVQRHYTREAMLPEALADQGGSPGRRDPDTAEPYEYRVIGGAKYELCATFQTSTHDEGLNEWNMFATHPAGRHCFEAEAKK